MPFDDLCVVLVEPTLPENVGAVARVMNNFGVSDLRVVGSGDFRGHRAAARVATRSLSLLHNLESHATLADAVAASRFVVGCTARVRERREGPVNLPRLSLRLPEDASLALVFGPENSGLSNRDLSHCHLLARIPARGEHASFNLAQAVGLVLYELFRSEGDAGSEPGRQLATSGELEGLKAHLFEVLGRTGFLKESRRESLWQSFSDLVFRARMGPEDVRILRGFLRSVQWALGRRPASCSGRAGSGDDAGAGTAGPGSPAPGPRSGSGNTGSPPRG